MLEAIVTDKDKKKLHARIEALKEMIKADTNEKDKEYHKLQLEALESELNKKKTN